MTKLRTTKEAKFKAQEDLLCAMQIAFIRLEESCESKEEKEQLQIVMSDQFARVEKMFGFNPYSFNRGV